MYKNKNKKSASRERSGKKMFDKADGKSVGTCASDFLKTNQNSKMVNETKVAPPLTYSKALANGTRPSSSNSFDVLRSSSDTSIASFNSDKSETTSGRIVGGNYNVISRVSENIPMSAEVLSMPGYVFEKYLSYRSFTDIDNWEQILNEFHKKEIGILNQSTQVFTFSNSGLFMLLLAPYWWRRFMVSTPAYRTQQKIKIMLKQVIKNIGFMVLLCNDENLIQLEKVFSTWTPIIPQNLLSKDSIILEHFCNVTASQEFNRFIAFCVESIDNVDALKLYELLETRNEFGCMRDDYELACEQITELLDGLVADELDQNYPKLDEKKDDWVTMSMKSSVEKNVEKQIMQFDGVGVKCIEDHVVSRANVDFLKRAIKLDDYIPVSPSIGELLSMVIDIANSDGKPKTYVLAPLSKNGKLAFGKVTRIGAIVKHEAMLSKEEQSNNTECICIWNPLVCEVVALLSRYKVKCAAISSFSNGSVRGWIVDTRYSFDELFAFPLSTDATRGFFSDFAVNLVNLSGMLKSSKYAQVIFCRDIPNGEATKLTYMPEIAFDAIRRTVFVSKFVLPCVIVVRVGVDQQSIATIHNNVISDALSLFSRKQLTNCEKVKGYDSELNLSMMTHFVIDSKAGDDAAIPSEIYEFGRLVMTIVRNNVKRDLDSVDIYYTVDGSSGWKYCIASFRPVSGTRLVSTIELHAIYCFNQVIGIAHKFHQDGSIKIRLTGSCTSLVDRFVIGDVMLSITPPYAIIVNTVYKKERYELLDYASNHSLTMTKLGFLLHQLYQRRVISYYQILMRYMVARRVAFNPDHKMCNTDCIKQIFAHCVSVRSEVYNEEATSKMDMIVSAMGKHCLSKQCVQIDDFFPGKKKCKNSECSWAVSPVYYHEVRSCCKSVHRELPANMPSHVLVINENVATYRQSYDAGELKTELTNIRTKLKSRMTARK